jgi:ABC-type lipoprotein release transport system permease subunit
LQIPYGQLAIVATMSIAVCLIAALVPAFRAGRLQPAVAMRYE